VVDTGAEARGRIAFTVRAKKGAFLIDSGRMADSPGVRRGVVRPRRHRGTLLRQQRRAPLGEAGFDASEWQTRADAAGGDVAAEEWRHAGGAPASAGGRGTGALGGSARESNAAAGHCGAAPGAGPV
jgi:hypothetical protein